VYRIRQHYGLQSNENYYRVGQAQRLKWEPHVNHWLSVKVCKIEKNTDIPETRFRGYRVPLLFDERSKKGEPVYGTRTARKKLVIPAGYKTVTKTVEKPASKVFRDRTIKKVRIASQPYSLVVFSDDEEKSDEEHFVRNKAATDENGVRIRDNKVLPGYKVKRFAGYKKNFIEETKKQPVRQMEVDVKYNETFVQKYKRDRTNVEAFKKVCEKRVPAVISHGEYRVQTTVTVMDYLLQRINDTMRDRHPKKENKRVFIDEQCFWKAVQQSYLTRKDLAYPKRLRNTMRQVCNVALGYFYPET
jgi:hypothetical protein